MTWEDDEKARADAYNERHAKRSQFDALMRVKLAGRADLARGLYDRTKARMGRRSGA